MQFQQDSARPCQVLFNRRLGGVSPPLGRPPEPGNRFVSFLRACARLVVRWDSGTNVCLTPFPFPFCGAGLSLFPSLKPCVQVSPIEFKWVQVSLSESKWVQVSPSESKWGQVSPSETKWVQVNPSETTWGPSPSPQYTYPTLVGLIGI